MRKLGLHTDFDGYGSTSKEQVLVARMILTPNGEYKTKRLVSVMI